METVDVSLDARQRVTALRNLLECNKDAYAWFLIMADESYDTPELVAFFTDVSTARLQTANDIEDELRQLGADTQTSVARLLARTWRDTASLFGKDTRDVMHRVSSSIGLTQRCCEDYEEALRMDWPPELRDRIEAQYQAITQLQKRLEGMQADLPPPGKPS